MALGRHGGSDKVLVRPWGHAALTGARLCSDTCTACLRCRRHGGCLQMRARQPPEDQMLHQPSRQAPTLLCTTAALLLVQQSCFLPLHELPRFAEPEQVSTSQLSPRVTLLTAHFMQFAAALLYFCSCLWACCRWPTARLAMSSIGGQGGLERSSHGDTTASWSGGAEPGSCLSHRDEVVAKKNPYGALAARQMWHQR